MLKKAICVLRDSNGQIKGVVYFNEISQNGPLKVIVDIHSISPGEHGMHIHKSGNDLHGPGGLCSHFNPTGKNHGARNQSDAHLGDLGNILANLMGQARETFIANYLRLRGENSILGRSLVVHEGRDDLGQGGNEESLKTGNSGARAMWGIIGWNSC